jgi:hypothetical protein
VLTGHIHIVFAPADVPRKGLAWWPSCHQRDIAAPIELKNDLLQFLRITQITSVRASPEVVAVRGDRIRPDVRTQDHFEPGPMQSEAQSPSTAEQIHSQWALPRQSAHISGQILQLTGFWMSF